MSTHLFLLFFFSRCFNPCALHSSCTRDNDDAWREFNDKSKIHFRDNILKTFGWGEKQRWNGIKHGAHNWNIILLSEKYERKMQKKREKNKSGGGTLKKLMSISIENNFWGENVWCFPFTTQRKSGYYLNCSWSSSNNAQATYNSIFFFFHRILRLDNFRVVWSKQMKTRPTLPLLFSFILQIGWKCLRRAIATSLSTLIFLMLNFYVFSCLCVYFPLRRFASTGLKIYTASESSTWNVN